MIKKSLIFFGRAATHACDGRCNKAWGINTRPIVQLSTNDGDFAYLADDELGEAPKDPGTYEGADAKPPHARGPDDVNKWCVRECERAWLSSPGHPNELPKLRDFSARLFNIPPDRPKPLITQLEESLSKEQCEALTHELDLSQKQALQEIFNEAVKSHKDDL